MTRAPDPWSRRPSGPPPRGRRAAWLVLMLGVAALLAFLAWRFPDALTSESGRARFVYLVALLALVSAGVLARRRLALREAARHLAVWVAVALVVVVGYGYRFELAALADRLLGELLPHRGMDAGETAISFRAGANGHFRIEALVDGTPIRFLVDTGASDVVLSSRDARRLGYDIEALSFTRTYTTANGIVRGAPVRLGEVVVGPIRVRDVRASITEGSMPISLLGLSFLERLRSYEVGDGTLTLRR